MDGIRFILEDPQAANSRQKKRSRLVTACDTCRAKKIKCHQSPGAPKCEACRVSKSACRFRDRERYHAQRSGSLSSTYAPSSCSSSEFDYGSTEIGGMGTYGEMDSGLNGLGLGVAGGMGMMARRATMPTFGALHSQNRSSSLPPALPRLPVALHMRSSSPGSEIGPHRVRKTSTRRNIGPVASSADYAHPHFRHHPHSAHSTPSLLGLSPLTNFRDLALDEPRSSYGANTSPYMLPHALNFDSSRPAHPSSAAMERGLDLFQEHFEQEDGGRFLWLHAEALRHTWRERALPAPVANCIAALALRFTADAPSPNGSNGGLVSTAKSHLGDPYLEMAKDLIVPLVYTPSVENLHSLILLSWGEYGTGRENGLNLYSALAVQMARELGLGSEDTIKTLPTEHEQSDLRQTWWAVVTLDIMSSFLTGNPTNLSLQGCTTAVPSSNASSPLSTSISADGTETRITPETPYLILYDLLSLRDRMLQALNFQMSSQNNNSPQQSQAGESVSSATNSPELQDILTRLNAIQHSLPSHLTLSLSNFRTAKRSGPGNQLIFVILHLVLGSLGIVGGAPSVFRNMGGVSASGLPESVRESARTILDTVVMLEQVDGAKAVTSFPFLDFSLALAARVFALESRAEQEQQMSSGSPSASPHEGQMERAGRGRFAEVNSGVCNNFLARLAEHWGNVSNVQMAVQSGTVWTIVCPVQQSPVAIPSALDLHGVQYGVHSDITHYGHGNGSQMQSREASPLLFEFPGMGGNPSFHGHRGSISGSSIASSHGVPPMPGSARSVSSTLSTSSDYEDMRPSSDPTPTTMLPPVSLAGGEGIGLGLNPSNMNGGAYDDMPISYLSSSSTNHFPGNNGHGSHHGQDLEYFSVLSGPNGPAMGGEANSPGMGGPGCVPVTNVYGNEANARVGSFPSSPWLMS